MVHKVSVDDTLLHISSGVAWQLRGFTLSCNTLYLLSPRLFFFTVLKRDFFIYRDDSLTSKRVIIGLGLGAPMILDSALLYIPDDKKYQMVSHIVRAFLVHNFHL